MDHQHHAISGVGKILHCISGFKVAYNSLQHMCFDESECSLCSLKFVTLFFSSLQPFLTHFLQLWSYGDFQGSLDKNIPLKENESK